MARLHFVVGLDIFSTINGEKCTGNLKGKFAINQLHNLLRNALGDIYTKYKPYKVNDGQYFNFNFKIYNKIVEIFSPEGSFPPFLICIPNTNSFLKDLIEFIAI